jgi:DNA polymerase III delta subunit
MITILHGDDIASSRNYYITERQKSKNTVILDGDKLTISDLMQSLEGGSLFNEEKDIFIENFFSGKKANANFKELVIYLDKHTNEANICFWENSELSKTELATFKKATIKLFKIPKNLFGFLDNIKPGNIDSVKQFHELLSLTPEELIFFMLVRQFRILLAISDIDTKNPIDELKRLAPWQMGKLKNQARLFGMEKLTTIYTRLYEIDSAYKQGKLPATLTLTIDFLLVDL